MQPVRIFGFRLAACIEMGLFFLTLSLLALFFSIPYNYYQYALHPYWIAVILISAQYGTNEGLLAALISTLLYLLGPQSPHNYLLSSFDSFFLLAKLPILWFVSAIVLGELRRKHIYDFEAVKKVALEAEAREKEVAESYRALKISKERLEVRVVGELETTLAAISAFRKLESTDIATLLQGASDLIKTLVAPEKFSLFLLQKGTLEKRLSDGWESKDSFASSFASNAPLYQEVIVERRTVSLLTSDPALLGKEGVVAVPLMNGDTPLGMIKIEGIPFFRLKMAQVETLRLLGEWIGKALSHYWV
ncbi:MAG: GAF domain-containing protein [Verrucomicrobiota bacterium]|nr:GAF domain-containing protein [Verrucomicrobiota bacterium]